MQIRLMHNLKVFFLCLLGLMLFSFKIEENSSFSDPHAEAMAQKDRWIRKTISRMSLEEKIAQFFMVAVYSNKDEAHRKEIEKLVTEQKVGGLIFFQGGPGRQAEMTNHYQSLAELPLLVSIDGEWGLSMRLDSTMKFPKQITLGAIQDNQLIYEMGRAIGEQCRTMGIHVNLAPVVDVNNNPNNPVINYRSFGEDKYNVALKGLAYAQGLQDAGVLAVAKHYPGHGDTDKDSHKTLPVIKHDMQRLQDLELYPFKLLFKNDVGGVMAAHLYIPAIDSTPNLAVSVSKKATTGLLKEELGFEGLVFSDALNMKGVSNYFEPGEVDAKAFIAGNDILLFSVDVKTGIRKIVEAVEADEIDEREIDSRLKKVLQYKFDLGLLEEGDSVRTEGLMEKLHPLRHQLIRKQLYQKAMTLVDNRDGMVPLQALGKKSFAAVALNAQGDQRFHRELSQIAEVNAHSLDVFASPASYENVRKSIADEDMVVISVHDMSWWASKDYGVGMTARNFIRQMSKEKDVILVLFGSPYAAKFFDYLPTVVVAYEENETTQELAARGLIGDFPFEGFLPVTAGSEARYGSGQKLRTGGSRMPYDFPENQGMNPQFLDSIELIVQEALDAKATPGCEVLVARNDKIVYHRAFGHHTYEDASAVKRNDLFDLASITKIAATTLSVMKLFDEGELSLEDQVGSHLDHLADTEIGKITIKDILMHQAGLKSWIPFYLRTVKDETVFDMIYCDDTTGGYCIRVANELYIRADYPDTIWNRIVESGIRSHKRYLYSDLGMYLLKAIIEQKTEMPLDEFVQRTFYGPMALERIGFNPLENGFELDEIIPTEHDRVFRDQVVHGYVHDPGAAMMGGVGGHAGLFATAGDLAEVMRMLLNYGSYGDLRLIKPSTVDYFTTNQTNLSRRGIGFDKPEPDKDKINPAAEEASLSAFGHLGFTGTVTWADPENELIYVFLSNRIHPTAENKKLLDMNIRTRIQSLIYKSLVQAPRNPVGYN